jgi:hypothetical protein
MLRLRLYQNDATLCNAGTTTTTLNLVTVCFPFVAELELQGAASFS